MDIQKKLFKLALEMSETLSKSGLNGWSSDFVYSNKIHKRINSKITIKLKAMQKGDKEDE